MEIKTKKENKQSDSNALIIFIRKPELGKVKTRLAADVGDEKALEIYKSLQRHTDIVATRSDATCYLFYAGELVVDDEWSQDQYNKLLQQGDDLGAKLKHAFAYVLARHTKVAVIGSDCAMLRAEHINQAFGALDTHDVVMGPTYDGGYYLLGMKDMYEELFDKMPWSTESVATETERRVAQHNATITRLEVLSDIDYQSDWIKYGLDYILTS